MTKPRRSIDKQEALVSEIHTLIRENTKAALDKARAGHRSVVVSGEGAYAYEWNHDAVGQALDNIMGIFGYTVTPIQ